jgi:hypothetical protein
MLEYNKKVINLVEDKERISQENRLDKWGLEERQESRLTSGDRKKVKKVGLQVGIGRKWRGFRV